MATVTLDCSEYDMLRETNKKREQEIEDIKKEKGEEIDKLKEEIKGLENGSRVIIKNTIYQNQYIPELKKCILISLRRYYGDYEERGLNDRYGLMTSRKPDFENIISDASMEAMDCRLSNMPRWDNSNLYGAEEAKEIVRYVGFDDIKMSIEQKIKEDVSDEYQRKMKSMETAKDNYEKELAHLNETVGKEHKKDMERLKKDYEQKLSDLNGKYDLERDISEDTKKGLEAEIEKLKTEMKDMKAAYENKLGQALKTNEEKIQEAQKELKDAQDKLEALGANKGFFSKLFKR